MTTLKKIISHVFVHNNVRLRRVKTGAHMSVSLDLNLLM